MYSASLTSGLTTVICGGFCTVRHGLEAVHRGTYDMQTHVPYRDQEDDSETMQIVESTVEDEGAEHRIPTRSIEFLKVEQHFSVRSCEKIQLRHSPSRRRISAIPVCDKRRISRTWTNVFRSVNAKMKVSNVKARVSVVSCTVGCRVR